MSVRQAATVHFGDFQPEELLGQLKAEQQTRNYDTAARFIEAVLGIELDVSNLRNSLQDGVILCKLINTLRPGAIKRINTRNLPFTQMENISNFLAAARKLGLKSTDLFQTVDLYEGKNMPRVIMTLLTIARVVAGIPLNSHKKLADMQRSLGDGWNASTLTTWTNSSAKVGRGEYITMHNQPTLVNSSQIGSEKQALAKGQSMDATSVLLARSPLSAKGNSAYISRKEHRRSKRGSAATLFIPSPSLATPPSMASAKPKDSHTRNIVTESVDRIDLLPAEIGKYAISDSTSKVTHIEAPASESRQSKKSALDADTETAAAEASDPDTSISVNVNVNVNADIGVSETELTTTKADVNKAQNTEIMEALQEEAERLSEAESKNAAALPPRKRTNTRGRPKERLTVYSESAQRLTNYQLGNCIGRGQFGSVYRALDLETGQMVAVKQIPVDGQNDEDMDDVMQEVELLKSLSSPRIVRYHGFVRTEAHLNLVMEYVENGSLSATLKSFGAFPEKLVLAYAVKIVEGLIYLHGRDVVHCDLKACNILTTKKGNTKLTDFGVSLNLKLRKPDDESVVAGTPYWMAPEIIQLDGACMASDIWSLGCTIIELLTGKPPYSGLMQMQALYRIVEDEHPPIPEGISEELKDFLLQCFRKDPRERPTATELMSHSWTAQYGRNRKELKMLRRTCSRKMSSFMARAQRTADNEYPTFDAARLKLDQLSPLAEQPGSDSADDDKVVEATDAEADADAYVDADKQESALCHSPQLQQSPQQLPQQQQPQSANTLVGDAVSGVSDAVSGASDDDTDASISTFEGPRMKRHRLRTILCDSSSACMCAVCGRALSGAFIQCSSCKTRCHDACTRHLTPCTAMRMSRFLYPASRKSSKRYESKTPNLRLRAHRKSTKRSHASAESQAAHVSASFADLISSTCGSHMGSIIGSSDASLHAGAHAGLRSSIFHDGFDGVVGDAGRAGGGRPASLAVTMGLSTAISQAQAQAQASLHGLPQPRSIGRQYGADLADSGWETDDTAEPPTVLSRRPPIDARSQTMPPAHPSVAGIRIPTPQQGLGPYSAPLQASSAPGLHDTHVPVPRSQDQGRSAHQPVYYQALSSDKDKTASMHSGAPVPALLARHGRPQSIRRQRANTASLECLSGSAPATASDPWADRTALSTLLRRRQHPLRGATSSDFKAVAGFSPGAAQRAKRGLHGSSASISDLQSCAASSEFLFGADSEGSSRCFAIAPKTAAKRSPAKRSAKDCIIM
ncbi:Protein kinase of the Mitotic Exit Network [Coemansia asiatica]|uniref:Protein kinase of the Mitotic Exit Network n=1 Tax=Coemansia asiatica TaxID=1052880 RepID=A0A9W8CI06_9FUNG|nr:Protein kinase of the Mitotic Exit Network [Coemansia asiatica]